MILMTANIHILHTRAEPVSGFLRIGHTGHRKLEALSRSRHASNRTPSGRLGVRLRIEDEKVAMVMDGVKSRLVRLRDALADLQATEGSPSRSRPPAFRGGALSISAVLGR